jgi:hypothetical protein
MSTTKVNSFPKPGLCQVCGCTTERACILVNGRGENEPCYWADETEMLCSNPVCLNTFWRGIEVVAWTPGAYARG